MIHLDTHVVAWLYAGLLDRIPAAVQRQLERDPLFISPMVVLELDYLHEIGRTTVAGQDVVADLGRRIGLHVTDSPFFHVVHEARTLDFTRDPFDRLICATAKVDGCPLLTADRTLLDAFAPASWA